MRSTLGNEASVRSGVLGRIKRLENRMKLAQQAVLRCGWLKPLPKDFVGERHVITVKRETTAPNIEWCEFEERPGPAPPNLEDQAGDVVYLIADDLKL